MPSGVGENQSCSTVRPDKGEYPNRWEAGTLRPNQSALARLED